MPDEDLSGSTISAVAGALVGSFEVRCLAVEPRQSDEGWATSLTLRLARHEGETPLEVRFNGVTQLSVKQTSSNFAITPRLVSIEDRGWEAAKFRFTDVEQGRPVEFYFWDAEVLEEPISPW